MKGQTFLPDDFALAEATHAWLEQKHPTVDAAETFAIFVDKALAKGWRYRDWQAAFRNYIRNGQLYGGVIHVRDREHDPRWAVLHDARKAGFREPHEHETPGSYRAAFEFWKTQPRSNVIDFGKVLKRV
jgi:hypothetical protein